MPLADRTGIWPGSEKVRSAASFVVPPVARAITVSEGTFTCARSGRVSGVPAGKETDAPPLGRVAVTDAVSVARVLPGCTVRGEGLALGFGWGIYSVSE